MTSRGLSLQWLKLLASHPNISETGWAYIEDGKVILDNEFERIPCGSALTLAEDEYTIVNFTPNPVQAMITKQWNLETIKKKLIR